MPAVGQGGKRADREHYPGLYAEIGEDPAQFLDHDLLGDSRHDTPLRTAIARIKGIDSLSVANAWLAIERRLDRGPREQIVELLEARIAHLEDVGERPDDLPSEDGPARYQARRVRDVEPVEVRWTDYENDERSLGATSKLNQLTEGEA